MCANIKSAKVAPGQALSYLTRSGRTNGIWGFRHGEQYNARQESLSTIWKVLQMNRGVITVDSFWEKGKEFIRKDGNAIHLAVIFNGKQEFAIITMPAGSEVAPYHHRMPVQINDADIQDWLSGKSMVTINHADICLKNAA